MSSLKGTPERKKNEILFFAGRSVVEHVPLEGRRTEVIVTQKVKPTETYQRWVCKERLDK